MFEPGEIISYLEMCQEEGVNLQRGMNYKLKGNHSVILMSLRKNAPYADRVEEEGSAVIYEGHDIPRNTTAAEPKLVDQPMFNPSGALTQNGLFYKAAEEYKKKVINPEIVRVYEKIQDGIWVFNGCFKLVDAWIEKSVSRNVFKFRLVAIESLKEIDERKIQIENTRQIPSHVKQAVWRRDKGRCVLCGNKENLHYDHIIPYSKGGSSLVADNIQILCAVHNLQKHDKIE